MENEKHSNCFVIPQHPLKQLGATALAQSKVKLSSWRRHRPHTDDIIWSYSFIYFHLCAYTLYSYSNTHLQKIFFFKAFPGSQPKSKRNPAFSPRNDAAQPLTHKRLAFSRRLWNGLQPRSQETVYGGGRGQNSLAPFYLEMFLLSTVAKRPRLCAYTKAVRSDRDAQPEGPKCHPFTMEGQ